jgi:heterodisulfide reductase subunit C
MFSIEKMTTRPDSHFLREVEKFSGESVSSCYQCRKCTSGCPVAFAMDIPPDRIMHMIHIGMKNTVLGSNTFWICASCETCSTRCPNEIDIAKVMETLRQICKSEGIEPKESQVPSFHEAFLQSFKRRGRVFELEMIGRYKLKTGQYTKDMRLGIEMFKKGKLRLFPHRIKGRKEIRDIFKKAEGSSGK